MKKYWMLVWAFVLCLGLAACAPSPEEQLRREEEKLQEMAAELEEMGEALMQEHGVVMPAEEEQALLPEGIEIAVDADAYWADDYEGDYIDEVIETENSITTLLKREDGSLAQKTVLMTNGDNLDETYDNNGNLRVQSVWSAEKTETSYYSAEGILIQYQYNDFDRQEEACYNADGTAVFRQVSHGNTVEVFLYHPNDVVAQYTHQEPEKVRHEYYDETGRLLETQEQIGTSLTIGTVYEEDGSYVVTTIKTSEKIALEETYDSSGNLIKKEESAIP